MTDRDDRTSPVTWLFAYGTLLPGEPRWHHLAPFVVDEGIADSVAGHLADTGEGYPAATFEPAGAATTPAGMITGRRFALVAELLDDALRVLDEVEGAVGGDYRRVSVSTSAGHAAWAYEYGGGLALTPIPSGSWTAHRGAAPPA